MRIPVFTSRAQRPGEAPGRPITARMRAEPLIQAELQRGAIVGEALDQVQQYSLMRHKAAVEVQMSESLLAAEEEMNAFARQMQNSAEIYNVFKPDGSGLWSETTAEMRDRLADNIESRSARNEFIARFNQREQAVRFRLQDEVDRRIQARAAAAASARMSAAEDRLSDPYNATPADYDMAVMGIRIDEDALIASGTATAETTGIMNQQLARNIANRTTQAYVFDDPTRAIALAEALDLQDEVNAGRMTAEEAYARSGLTDDAAYTLYTLDVLPREQALEIIYDTLGRSNRLFEAAERRRAEVEAADNAARDRAYRGMFMFADTTREFTVADLMTVAPSVAAMSGLSATPDAPLTAEQAREAFMSYFNAFNYLTPEQRRTIEGAFNRPPVSRFATETNQDVYTDLFSRAEAGNLTVAGLEAASGSITSENFTTLLNKIGAEADDALNDAKSVVRLRFGYDAEMALDSEAARLAQASYFSISSQLEQMATTRRAEGNPMTRSEINDEAQRLTNAQMEIFRAQVRDEMQRHIQFRMTNITNMAPIGMENPVADLDAWWASLSPVEQENFKNDYWTHRLSLSEFQQRMNR